MSVSAAPRSTMPRMISLKWVSGSTWAIHCATFGMPSNGNMKPDIRIDGSIVTIAIWIAWNCVCASVEMNEPERQRGGDEEQRAEVEVEQPARDRHVEQPVAERQDQRRLDQADRDVRQELAGHQLARPRPAS